MVRVSRGPKGGWPPAGNFLCNRSRSISATPNFAFSRSLSSSSPLAGFVSTASPSARRSRASRSGFPASPPGCATPFLDPPHAAAAAPPRCCVAVTSGHHARAPHTILSGSLRLTRPRANPVRLIVLGSPFVRKSSAREASQSTALQGINQHQGRALLWFSRSRHHARVWPNSTPSGILIDGAGPWRAQGYGNKGPKIARALRTH